ncbi:MAG: DNA-methyltransferase [Candidatus Dormibacteria bacterium]
MSILPADAPSRRWRAEQSDCLDLLRSLPAASIDCVVTDPAYSGMNQHLQLGHGRIVGRYASGPRDRWFSEFEDDAARFAGLLDACHHALAADGHLYVMFDSFSLLSLGALVRERFAVKNLLVWDKVRLGMGHNWRRRHETIVFATKGRRPLRRRDLPDVITVPRLGRAAYPTQKPVALFDVLLSASAEPGMSVCDPFMGTASTGVAALRAGCAYVGGDTSETAVSLARGRLAAVAGGAPDPLERPASPL